MSALSIQVPFPVFNNRDGQPLDNGYVWIGVPNLPPQTNPVNVYFDEALTIIAPQPLRTINGYISRFGSPAQVYVDGVDFSILVQDSKGTMVYNFAEGTGISPNASGVAFTGFKGQVGFVSDLADDDGSDWIGFEPAGSGAVARSAQDKMRDIVSVKDFGAVGDGVTDDTAAINAAATAAAAAQSTLYAEGTFFISGSLNLRNVRVDFSSAVLILDTGAPSIVIGGSSATTINPRQEFKRVYRNGGATATPTLRVAGTKDQTFFIDACDYLQLYADTTAPNANINGSIAYCTFNLGKIDKLELTNNPANTGPGAGDGGSIQWINENRFNLQRCADFSMSGTYEHNHNIVVGGTFESTSSITITKGWDNYFYDVRFEGTPVVTLGATTERNVIINTWDSSTSNPAESATVVDNGFDNIVMDDFGLYRQAQTVAYTDLSDVVLNTQTQPIVGRSTTLQRIYTTTITQPLVESEFVPINSGDYFRWVAVGPDNEIANTNARYRPRIEFYDASLRPVTANANFISTTGGVMTSVSGNSISAGNNVSGAIAVILPAALTANVRFVKVIWRGNSPSTFSISQAIQLFVTQFTKKSNTFQGVGVTKNSSQGAGVLVSGVPTQAYAPAGYTAIKSDASAKYVNLFAAETVSTSAYLAGATAIAVTSVSGVTTGDIVGVNLDDGTTHWTTVAVGSTTTSINLTAGLPSDSASNSRVVFNRWSTY